MYYVFVEVENVEEARSLRDRLYLGGNLQGTEINRLGFQKFENGKKYKVVDDVLYSE